MKFDLDRPSPDAGHEGIRQAVVKAIADLQLTSGDAELGLALADMVFLFLDESAAANDALQAQVAALTARLDAHVGAGAVLPGPDAAG